MLNELMQCWGSREGLFRYEVLEALREHKYKKRDYRCKRFSISRVPSLSMDDYIITVHDKEYRDNKSRCGGMAPWKLRRRHDCKNKPMHDDDETHDKDQEPDQEPKDPTRPLCQRCRHRPRRRTRCAKCKMWQCPKCYGDRQLPLCQWCCGEPEPEPEQRAPNASVIPRPVAPKHQPQVATTSSMTAINPASSGGIASLSGGVTEPVNFLTQSLSRDAPRASTPSGNSTFPSGPADEKDQLWVLYEDLPQ